MDSSCRVTVSSGSTRVVDGVSGLTRMSETDRERFRIALNILLAEGFLIRAFDQHDGSYRFVLSNLDLFEAYLAYAGWSLRRDDALGIVALTGPAAARLRLRKDESIVVLILRLLYEEKAGDIQLHGERTVRRHEIQDRYLSLTGKAIRKTAFLAMLRRFQALRLLRVVGHDSDPDAVVVLYPTLAFVLSGDALDEIEARLAEYTSDDTSDAADAGDETVEVYQADIAAEDS